MIIDQIKQNFQEAQAMVTDFIENPENWEKLNKAGILMAETLRNGGENNFLREWWFNVRCHSLC
jgi:D-sedoheptulose 7-phosphate isomerase